MATVTFSLGGYQNVGDITYDVQRITGDGGAAYPVLTIPVDLTVKPIVSPSRDSPGRAPKTIRPVTVLNVTGILRLREGIRIAEMVPQLLDHHSFMAELGSKRTLYLEFPLDARRISALEEKRRGCDLSLRISLGFLGALHAEVPIGTEGGPGSVATFETGSADLELLIPQSEWAGSILSKLGHGDRAVMELPIPAPSPPPDKRQAMNGALSRLQEAWAAFARGNDPEVLRTCYLLWERLVRDLHAGDQPDQNAFLKLFDAIGTDQAKRDVLRHLCRYLAAFNHLGRHEQEPPVQVDHRDAEFALLATQVVLVYLAKLM